MSIEILGVFITLLLGVFVLIGAMVALLVSRKGQVIDFSLGLAFSVIIMLIVLDLIPEVIEHLGISYIWLFLIFVIFGYGLLRILDHFVPDHHEKEHEKVDEENLTHIGIVASVALILHNIIEGMAIYTSVLSSLELGILMCIGVGLHNIPMGMVIASTFYTSKKHLKRTIGIVFLTAISTLFGGLLMFFMSGMLNEFLLGILLAITTGMVLYIAVFELFPHLVEHKKEKGTITGVLLGVALLLVSVLLGGHHH